MVIITSPAHAARLDADVHVEMDALRESAARATAGDILRRGSFTVDDTANDAVATHRLPLTIRHIADRIVADRTPSALRTEPHPPDQDQGLEAMRSTIQELDPADHLVLRRMALHPGRHVTGEVAAALAGLPLGRPSPAAGQRRTATATPGPPTRDRVQPGP
ncbi:hypothetical protein [Streptomyces sp. NPDC006140]|uniref:hypothetical protein n=1 Tax=Streptomyces sp. NPDC006140 TaxID=3154579 RepID=UPI0034085B15